MKTIAILFSLLVALPAFAQSGRPLRAALTGFQEVPSVSTRAEGFFEARIADNNQSFDYELSYDGLQGNVVMAHIHFAQRAVNGPIVIWLCGTPPANTGPAGTQTCPQSGTVRGTITAANVLASPATQQLAAGEIGEIIEAMRAAAAYVNVHSSISPGGELRGQINDTGTFAVAF